MIEDLVSEFIPTDAKELFADTSWEMYYEHHPDFKDVVFSQFEKRLSDHRKQIKKGLLRSKIEESAMLQDRQRFPRQRRNQKGELVFDLHPARDLLRKDVAEKLHVGVTPKMLQSYREEYKEFDLKVFRQRIYQTMMREKFVNWLQFKREQGKLLRVKPPGDLSM